jgi:hypothetical protein
LLGRVVIRPAVKPYLRDRGPLPGPGRGPGVGEIDDNGNFETKKPTPVRTEYGKLNRGCALGEYFGDRQVPSKPIGSATVKSSTQAGFCKICFFADLMIPRFGRPGQSQFELF